MRLGAILHTKVWKADVSTCDPHQQMFAEQRPRPSRKATATRTASSLRRIPHEAIGSADSQSPLCLVAAAKKAAFINFIHQAVDKYHETNTGKWTINKTYPN